MFNKWLLLEILILAQSPIPFYDKYIFHNARGNVLIFYFFSEIQTAVMSLRSFFIVRAVLNYSRYTDSYSKKLCQMYGFHSGTVYVIKCELSERPVRTLSMIFVFFIIQYTYLMRVFELPYYRTAPGVENNFMDSFF